MDQIDFFLGYLLGAVTLFPLLTLSIFAHFYFLAPRVDNVDDDVPETPDKLRGDPTSIVQPGDESISRLDAHRRDEEVKAEVNTEPDDASGYFAVCRDYYPMGIKPTERLTPFGLATAIAPSLGVYQTMYRAFFDRGAATPDPFDDRNILNQRPKKAGNVFYLVLRHGHLVLFDDEQQLEVRHVISLAHHDVSVYAGANAGPVPEGELWIKRNAICLTRRYDPAAGSPTPDVYPSKPFYLFCEDCSAKEDFYFALLRNQRQTFGAESGIPLAPPPAILNADSMLSLVNKLHSAQTDENVHNRWFNALLGRVFLGISQTDDIRRFVIDNLTKKMSRVKLPSLLTGLEIRKVDAGCAAPYISNPRLQELGAAGECNVEVDVHYAGNFRIEVAATARFEIGQHFTRDVELLLAVLVRRVEGHLLIKIKPPPSNRVWYAFSAMPHIEMVIEPVVISRLITYPLVLRQIESRIKEVLAETFVVPFWDDMPFLNTEHKQWRGGIFETEDAQSATGTKSETGKGKHNVVVESSPESKLVDKINEKKIGEKEPRGLEKSHSLPNIEMSIPLSQPGGQGHDGENEKDEQSGKHKIEDRKTDTNKANKATAAAAAAAVAAETEDENVKSDGKKIMAHEPISVPSLQSQKPSMTVKGSDQPRRSSFVEQFDDDKHDNSVKRGEAGRDEFSGKVSSMSPNATWSTKDIATTPVQPISAARSVSHQHRQRDGDNGDAGDDVAANPRRRRNVTMPGGSLFMSDESVASSSKAAATSARGPTTGSIGRALFLRREPSNSTFRPASSRGNGSSLFKSVNSSAVSVQAINGVIVNNGTNGTNDTILGANSLNAASNDTATGPNTAKDGGKMPNPKRNTLTAVQNAAAQARQWGWNALQRRKDQQAIKDQQATKTDGASGDNSANGSGVSGVDLRLPMGRGKPLPPLGQPLPGPDKGSSNVTARKSSTSMAQTDEQIAGKGKGRNAAQVEREKPGPVQTSLRRRRLMLGSRSRSESSDNISLLVVAAPEDSSPPSPTEGDAPTHKAERVARIAPVSTSSWLTAGESSDSGEWARTLPAINVTSEEYDGDGLTQWIYNSTTKDWTQDKSKKAKEAE